MKSSNILFEFLLNLQPPFQNLQQTNVAHNIWVKDFKPKQRVNRTNITHMNLFVDKLKLTGRNLGQVFKSRFGRVCIGHEMYTFVKQPNLNLRLGPNNF